MREATGPTAEEASEEGVHVLIGAFYPLSADGLKHPTAHGCPCFRDASLTAPIPVEDPDILASEGIDMGWFPDPGFNTMNYDYRRHAPVWQGSWEDRPFGNLGGVESGSHVTLGYVDEGWISEPGFNYSGYATSRGPTLRGEFTDRPFGNLGGMSRRAVGSFNDSPGMPGEISGVGCCAPGSMRDIGIGSLRGRLGVFGEDGRRVNPGRFTGPGFNTQAFETPSAPSWRGPYNDRPFGNLGGLGDRGLRSNYRGVRHVDPGWQSEPGFNNFEFETPSAPAWRGTYSDRPYGNLASSGMNQRAVGGFNDSPGMPGEVHGVGSFAPGSMNDIVGSRVGLMYVERSGERHLVPTPAERRAWRDAEDERQRIEWDSEPTYGKKDTFIGRNITNDVGTDYAYYLGRPADTTAVPVGFLSGKDASCEDTSDVDACEKALHAALALRKWAESEHFHPEAAWKSSDGTAHGYQFALPSEHDRMEVAQEAKRIAARHNTFYKVTHSDEAGDPMGSFRVFFTADPAAIEVTVEDAEAAGFEVGAAHKSKKGRSPGARKAARRSARSGRAAKRLSHTRPGGKREQRLTKKIARLQPGAKPGGARPGARPGAKPMAGRPGAKPGMALRPGTKPGGPKVRPGTKPGQPSRAEPGSFRKVPLPMPMPKPPDGGPPPGGGGPPPGGGGPPPGGGDGGGPPPGGGDGGGPPPGGGGGPPPGGGGDEGGGDDGGYDGGGYDPGYDGGYIDADIDYDGGDEYATPGEDGMPVIVIPQQQPTPTPSPKTPQVIVVQQGQQPVPVPAPEPEPQHVVVHHDRPAPIVVHHDRPAPQRVAIGVNPMGQTIWSSGAEHVTIGFVRPRPGVGPDDVGTYGRFFTYGRGSNFQYPL